MRYHWNKIKDNLKIKFEKKYIIMKKNINNNVINKVS